MRFIFVRGWVKPRATVRIRSIKELNDPPTWKGTHDLPACSMVPQPTTLPSVRGKSEGSWRNCAHAASATMDLRGSCRAPNPRLLVWWQSLAASAHSIIRRALVVPGKREWSYWSRCKWASSISVHSLIDWLIDFRRRQRETKRGGGGEEWRVITGEGAAGRGGGPMSWWR
jgi:hypothetical protein